jgi:hypothetical protein
MIIREDVIYSKLSKDKALFRNIAGIVNLNNGFSINLIFSFTFFC